MTTLKFIGWSALVVAMSFTGPLGWLNAWLLTDMLTDDDDDDE